MYHKILVPLDGSKRAERILGHVEELARRYDATAIFLQVIRSPIVTCFDETGMLLHQQEVKESKQQAKLYLKSLQGEFREKGLNAQVCVLQAQGSVAQVILDAAKMERADLVAICSHGRSGLNRLFYGSVTSGLLNRIDRPILVIRSRADE
jgi:nucleotide-binding universal stress UspA family protein